MKDYGFLGADVSKGMCNFVLQDFQGKELEPNFQLDDNQSGHETLFKLLKEFRRSHKLVKIVIGLESTGGYENNWYVRLRRECKALGLEVYRINPKRIYHEAKSEGRRTIDDGVSARVIAGYISKNYGKLPRTNDASQATDAGLESLRRFHKYIGSLIKQNVRNKNSLEKLLYQTMPELLTLKGDKFPTWFLDLLISYPTKSMILNAEYEGLTSIKHITKQKAKAILESVKQSIGGLDSYCEQNVVRAQAEDIKRLNQKVKSLKEELRKAASIKLEKQIKLLTSIRGIGEDTAVGILLELGDLNRFSTARNLVAFWGINPTFKQSGDKKIYIGMSKDGSPRARALLFFAAMNVMIHEPYFKALYAKQMKKGKSHCDALGVLMSKLTRIIYGVLKNDSVFEAGVDRFNQEKKPIESKSKVKPESRINMQRRYQEMESDAPISWRQRKKRRQETSALS